MFAQVVQYTAEQYVADQALDPTIQGELAMIQEEHYSALLRSGLVLEVGPLGLRSYIVLVRNAELDKEVCRSKFSFGGKDILQLHSAIYKVTSAPADTSNPTLVFTRILVYNDCPLYFIYPSQASLAGTQEMSFLVVDDSELLKFLDMKAGELLPEEVPRLKIPAEERLQIKASGDGESPLVMFKKSEFTGTKRMQDPVTRELLSYMDSSSFEADVDESRFCRRIMSSERKVVFLNLHGVKLKIDEFGAQLEVAGESAYHADRGNLFSVHSFGEGAFKNWHKILGLPIFAREANGGRSKTFASFLAGDWHGPLGASIGDLHLGHFCSNPLYGGSFSYAAKASMGVAIENVGHIFSLVSGIDYTPSNIRPLEERGGWAASHGER
jgi:hypothetical protein